MSMPLNETPPIQRKEFIDALSRHIAESVDTTLGLVLIDICNLTSINHLMGFEQGDVAINETHVRLLSLSKLPDTVFRISGSHFVFILPKLANPAFIALATNKIKRTLIEEIPFTGGTIDPDIQLGIAISLEEQHDALGYLAQAEHSLIKSKAGIPYTQQGQKQEERVLYQKDLEQSFKETLQSNGFDLFYQPKLNLQSGVVDKAEALLRWQLPTQEFISPEVVVDLADKFGESYTLTKWVIHTAARQIKAWQSSMDIDIAVNVQASLIAGPDLISLVRDALTIWGAQKNRLTVEITESAVIEDKESGLNNLLQLKEDGVALSIDDFGTGYSSLSYFKEIPATELKIDQSFVMNMLSNQQDRDIVKVIVQIAHLFDLKVVAEGIEDEATLDYLKSLGCDYGQGYYIARPMPADKFEAWYKTYSARPNPSGKTDNHS